MFFKLTSRARARHTGVTPRYAEGGGGGSRSGGPPPRVPLRVPRARPPDREERRHRTRAGRARGRVAAGGGARPGARRAHRPHTHADTDTHGARRSAPPCSLWTLLGARRLCTNCNIGINCVFASCMSESVTDRVTDTDVKLKRRGHLCPQTQGKPQQQHTSSPRAHMRVRPRIRAHQRWSMSGAR